MTTDEEECVVPNRGGAKEERKTEHGEDREWMENMKEWCQTHTQHQGA